MDKNHHISDYLKYYTSLSIPPLYSVLLFGPWGAGKTWFIKRFIKEMSDEGKSFIYISLNGVTSYKEIEDDISLQVNPFLNSKGMKLLGKVASGLLKTSLNIDLNGDNKTDATLSSTVPNLDLASYFNKLGDRILVFDDLERCGIDVVKIMGYINQYVEIHELKVILLANEAELAKGQDYLRIKEKLIGKSFLVQSDLENAISLFLDSIEDNRARYTLKKYRFLVDELFQLAGYDNLRHLKQSIHDWERFAQHLPSIAFEKDDVIEHIIYLFLCVSFELGRGNLKKDEIANLFTRSLWSDEETPEEIKQIRIKYDRNRILTTPVQGAVWRDYFIKGTVSKDLLEESIKSSTYFQVEEAPLWLKLWNFFNYEDHEFELLINEAIAELVRKNYSDPYVATHIIGILMSCSNLGLISNSKEEILKLGKENIDKLRVKKLLQRQDFGFENSAYGHHYHGENILEFKEFLTYLEESLDSFKGVEYSDEATQLIITLKESPVKFGTYITLTNSSNNKYYNTPILNYMDVCEVCEVFFELTNKQKTELTQVFERRYNSPQLNVELVDELDWLAKLESLLRARIEEFKGKITGLRLLAFIETIGKAKEKLEMIKE